MSDQFQRLKNNAPTLGVGLGFRRELAEDTFKNRDRIDWLEITPENYMAVGGLARAQLEEAIAHFPVVSHGVNLSIGSADDLNEDYLVALKKLLDKIDAPWWSDHLCYASIDGTYLHQLQPLPFSRQCVKHVAERIKKVQDFIERPFLIENISYYMNMPNCQFSEANFISEVLEEADCGLLLDVNNVFVNATNFKYDPIEYLNQIPLDRTVQIHVAGHSERPGMLLDDHGAAVVEPVFEILEQTLKRTRVNAVMLERDVDFPEFDDLLKEVDVIREIAGRVQPELLSVSTI